MWCFGVGIYESFGKLGGSLGESQANGQGAKTPQDKARIALDSKGPESLTTRLIGRDSKQNSSSTPGKALAAINWSHKESTTNAAIE